MSGKTKWQIRIAGYGTFEFIGNENEAEEMRKHKANWEQGNGMKWRADLSRTSDRLAAQIADLWDSHKGAPMKLMTARKRALADESRDTP